MIPEFFGGPIDGETGLEIPDGMWEYELTQPASKKHLHPSNFGKVTSVETITHRYVRQGDRMVYKGSSMS